MSNRLIGYAIPAIAAVALIAASGTAMAAKKMSYEDAFAKCKQEMGAAGVNTDSQNSAARHSAGAACMKKYGFRLKK